MYLKRHILLFFLSLFFLSLLLFGFFALVRQSVLVRVYDASTGGVLLHAIVENHSPAQRQTTLAGWLFRDVDQHLSINVTAAGYLPAKASWNAPYPWALRGRLNVFLFPTQLTGIVRDADSGQPLSGVSVQIGAKNLLSDASGSFHFSGLAGDDIPLSVQCDGYEPGRARVLWQNHLLQKEPLAVDLQPNSIEGRVRWRETDEPISGAGVSAAGQQRITDREGNFILRRLRHGDIITVERQGFWPVEVTYSGQDLDIVLTPNTLKGQVRWRETGEPLPEATLTVGERQLLADEMGLFQVDRLRVGDIITVEQAGFWPVELEYSGQITETEINLQDRQARVVVKSALEGVELSGLTVTREGQELATTSAGFDLRICKVGEMLKVSADGHRLAQVHLGAASAQNAGSVEEVEILLDPQVLTMTVRDAYSGWPLTGIQIKSSPAKFTDSAGQVVLAPVTPGDEIVVEHPDYAGQIVRYEGDASELELGLIPRIIHGSVVDAITGKPVSGATLRQGRQTLLHSSSDGTFQLEGQHSFMVRAPGYRLTQVTIGDHSSPIVARSCITNSSVNAPCWEIQLAPFEVKGLYIPFGLLYLPQRVQAILDMIKGSEFNAIVVDVKGDRGWLAYTSELPLAVELGVSVGGLMDIREFLKDCRRRGIYTIARLVVFKDNPLAHGKAELAVKQADGSVWLDREELGWANPYREEVWDYNIGLAQEVAQLGFDEIQLDYLRFPSDGDLAKIVYEEEDSPEAKTSAIRGFMARMREALEPYDVFLSADVFGLTLVVDPQSGMGIGQRVIDIAPYVDYLCPMVYPSTFISGNMGIANPALYPYKVVAESLRRGMKRTSTFIRPWLQAYSLAGVKYDLARQGAQRRAAEEMGACGWTFWNAGGRYDEGLFRQRYAPLPGARE